MRAISDTSSLLSKQLLITGLILFVLNIITNSILTNALWVGVPIIIAGFCASICSRKRMIKRKQLKEYGKCFSASNVYLTPVRVPRIAGFYSFYINAEFTDDMRNSHAVRSPLLSSPKRKQIVASRNGTLLFKNKPAVMVYTRSDNINE
jgi:hypothetical protein